jgi:PAS domain S-box-containing protein
MPSLRDELHLWFLESLDRINRSIQATSDLEQMMSDVLGTALSIFDSDRVWLVYPCDPKAPSWRVPMERTKPQYPGSKELNLEWPMDPEVAQVFTLQLASSGPLTHGPGGMHPMSTEAVERFGCKSVIATTLFPKSDRPWLFGMHQCSNARVWSAEEQRLFQEIARRLSDALTSLSAYEHLMASEARYRRIVETAVEGIWVLGADMATTFVNARMADLLGYSVTEMKGLPARDFILDEELEDHQKRMTNREQGVSETFERRLRGKDGRVVWVLVSATPIFDEQHRFQGSFAMLTDITTRKRAEAELIKAKEVAEQAAQTKAQFLDIAAHELRTPVAALSVMIELGKKQMAHGQSLNVAGLDRLLRQTSRLSRLVADLLDVSGLDRGAVTLHRAHLDLASLISTCIEEFRAQTPERTLAFGRPAQPVEVDADPVRIQQVLSNLIDNAIKYTPENLPIEVTVEPSAGRVRVSVIDHGAGITREQQAELFKPFARGSSAREEQASGLGLGLFVSDGIVRLHGGAIGVMSEPGVGSTFYFELPTNLSAA